MCVKSVHSITAQKIYNETNAAHGLEIGETNAVSILQLDVLA